MNKKLAVLGLAVGTLFLLSGSPITLGASVSTQEWRAAVSHTPLPAPGTGCFQASYPSMSWTVVPCLPSSDAPPESTGNGNDVVGNSGTTLIGDAEGFVWSMSGFSSESDSVQGSNWYSLQMNSNTWSCTYNSKSTKCWEQFAFVNNGCSSCKGYVFIQYWLLGYYQSYSSCPSGWGEGNTYPNPGWENCYNGSGLTTTNQENPSNLANLFLEGFSNYYYGYSGHDAAEVCDVYNCWVSSASDTVLSLYQNWYHAEWNVLGYSGSQANFNTGISVTLRNYFYSQSAAGINPTCSTGQGYSGETNNMNYGGSCSTGTGYYALTETH